MKGESGKPEGGAAVKVVVAVLAVVVVAIPLSLFKALWSNTNCLHS